MQGGCVFFAQEVIFYGNLWFLKRKIIKESNGKVRFVLTVFMLVLGAVSAQADAQKPEYLAYKVKYGFLLAGYYEILYQPLSENKFELMSRAWSAGAASVYSLYDKFYIKGVHEPALFLPEKSILKLAEGDYKAHKEVIYDRPNKEVTYTNFLAKKVTPVKMDMPSEALRDTFTALYFLRHTVKNAKVGSVYSVPIQALDKQYELKVFIEKEEKIKTEAGSFKTFKVKPITYKDGREYKSKIVVWVTKESYMPVQIEADLKLGSFEAKLLRFGEQEFKSDAPKDLNWGE